MEITVERMEIKIYDVVIERNGIDDMQMNLGIRERLSETPMEYDSGQIALKSL